MLFPLYSKKKPNQKTLQFFDLESRMNWVHMLYQNITSGSTCLYFWKCVWSEAACFTVAQKKQVCAGLWETEAKPAFRETKWTGSSKVRRTAVALGPCSKSELPSTSNFPQTCKHAEFQMLSQFWRDLAHEFCPHYAGWLCRRVDVLSRASICFIGEAEETKKCMGKG